MLKDQVPAEVLAFFDNCDNADVLRFLNQKVLMPKLQGIYGRRLDTYREKLVWGDVVFAPWGDGKSYAGMIWEVIDEHTLKVNFFDSENPDKPKLYTIETKTVSAVAYLHEISADGISEDDWKGLAMEAVLEAKALIIDSDPVLPADNEAFVDGMYWAATYSEE